MNYLRQTLLEHLQHRARRDVGRLAREWVSAESDDKECLLAAMQFERWLAEACDTRHQP